MIALTRRYRFPAAHVLAHPDLSDADNARIYGKCANPGGHGHDYGLEITVAGEIDPGSGQVFDRDVPGGAGCRIAGAEHLDHAGGIQIAVEALFEAHPSERGTSARVDALHGRALHVERTLDLLVHA